MTAQTAKPARISTPNPRTVEAAGGWSKPIGGQDMQEHTAGVYRITCQATGRHYIGSSTDVDKRLSSHRYRLQRQTHHCHALQEDWQHHTLTSTVLEHCPADTIREREQWHIVQAKKAGHALYNQRGASSTPATTEDDTATALEDW